MRELNKPILSGGRLPSFQLAASGWQTAIVKRGKDLSWKLFRYVVICSLAFVFLYPMLFMVSQSFMRAGDIADATVQWIPKSFSLENFKYAVSAMGYWPHFRNSLLMALGGAGLQLIGCSIAGYGFARYSFPGYRLWLALLLLTFLVPPQSIIVPLFLFFSDLHWRDTYYPFLVPALFGHGLRGSLFVMVFMQTFRGLPHQLEEAARIDGAGAFRTFASIMLPLARPAILVVFLFSIVWHWNDTFFPDFYLNKDADYTLNQKLGYLTVTNQMDSTSDGERGGDDTIAQLPTNYQKIMAGALVTILPLLLLYLFTQRYFVESMERTGIAGE